MEYSNILCNWFSDENFTVTELKKGISSNACHVRAGNGAFILRRVAGREQADREALVLSVLASAGVAPALLPCTDGCFWTELDGSFYNLQRVVPGKAPDFTDRAVVISVAEAVAKMHRTFAESCLRIAGIDRFDTLGMLERARGAAGLDSFFPEDVVCFEKRKEYVKRKEASLQREQVIHGDLGGWNMLWDGEQTWLIDFGECRLGDTSLDLAAVLASVVSVAEDGASEQNTHIFLEIYEKTYEPVSRERLRTACWLWQLRGVLASVVFLPVGSHREKQIQLFIQNYNRLMRVL